MQPIFIALLRAALGGFVIAGSVFFGQLTTGSSTHTAIITAGAAFFGYLITRGIVEGVIDQQKAST